MTQSSTDASSPLEYLWYAYGGTDTCIDDLLSCAWRWDPPTAIPVMYVQKPMPRVIEPHIKTMPCKRFLGHKFGLGGSKK